MSVASMQSIRVTNSLLNPSSHSCSSLSTVSKVPFSISKGSVITITCSQTDGPLRRPSIASPPIRPSAPENPPPAPVSTPPETTVVGQNVVTMEFQRQKAKELQQYFKQKKIEEANISPFYGFIAKNEISNGRWAMFGLLLGEYATGSDFVDQVGSGTYSNVYKARDRKTKKIVALKKVRFDTSEPESIKFMAREIMMLRKLDHPNIVKLEGLATSRMQYSLYLVFDYMQTDLSRIISRPDERLNEPQVKFYMHQLLSGLQHCHERGILHRDIKGSNLLIDKSGNLKIADFGLANYYDSKKTVPLTNRVVTLWYRSPELLLGATLYGPGIDLWSAGCLLAEMFAGRPIMPGRTEVEQLHKIFKLCGSPSDDYWKKLKLSTTFRPPHSYKPNLCEAFRDYPRSAVGLLMVLLALDPAYRGSASSALQHEFFHTSPWACDLSGLPVIRIDDDDLAQTNEIKKLRKARTRQKARRLKEQQKNDQTVQNLYVESATLKEEAGNKPDVVRKNDELVMTKTSPSSPSVRPSPTQEILAPIPSPENIYQHYHPIPSPENIYQHYQRQMSESHPNAKMNIKNRPPLPGAKRLSAKYGGMIDEHLTHVPRSSSTREYRKMDQRKLNLLDN